MKTALMVLRGFFIILSVGIAFTMAGFLNEEGSLRTDIMQGFWAIGFLAAAVGLSFVDKLFTRKTMPIVAAVVFGLLVGGFIAYLLGIPFELLMAGYVKQEGNQALVTGGKLLMTVVICYLTISFVVRTRDNFRFIIPYIEFAKEVKGLKPLVLDTSVIIDGRIADVVETHIITSPLVIPRFVLQELHNVSDSADKLKRNRGRRGLDMLNRLQTSVNADVHINETVLEPGEKVDEKLVELSKNLGGSLITNDFNLNKLATLQGVEVININDLAQALRPVILPGEAMQVKVVKAGEGYDQGVGYLEDGTMVVVEHGRASIGSTVGIVVTSLIQTSAGRMIFGKIEGAGNSGGDRRGSGSSNSSSSGNNKDNRPPRPPAPREDKGK